MAPSASLTGRLDMRNHFITLGMTLLLWFGQAQAAKLCERGAGKRRDTAEQNIGEDLGPLATRPLRNCARICASDAVGISNPHEIVRRDHRGKS